MIANICRRFFEARWTLAAALILAIAAISATPASAQYYERPGHWWWNGRAYVWVYDPPPPVYVPPPVVYAPPPAYYASPVYAYPSFSFVFGGGGHDHDHHHH